MDRQQLAHLLRAASKIAGDPDIVVFGSQSILGSYDEDDLPRPATASLEADIAFLDDQDRVKADSVEGGIGEMSAFHGTHGIYAEGIHVDTVTLPEGWRDRTVQWNLQSSHPANAHFLDPHDLAISKLAAYRTKDLTFVNALTKAGLLNTQTLRERVALLPADTDPRAVDRITSWIDGTESADWMAGARIPVSLEDPKPEPPEEPTPNPITTGIKRVLDAVTRERPSNPNRRVWCLCNALTSDGGRCKNLKGSCPHH